MSNTITNESIAKNFSLLAKLMEVHGENPFKIRSYSNVVRVIEKYPTPLSELSVNEIAGIKGVGEAIAQKILDQIATGHLPLLDKFLEKTPVGIVEMLGIKGLGPKKVQTIWKDLEIETIGELLYACNENRLLHYKGFGEKTQENIRQAIEFFQQSQGLFLYAQVEPVVISITEKFTKIFPNQKLLVCSTFREQQEIIEKLSFVTDLSVSELDLFAKQENWSSKENNANTSVFVTPESVRLEFLIFPTEELFLQLFLHTGSEAFHAEWKTRFPESLNIKPQSEDAIFLKAGTEFIPAYMRDFPSVIDKAVKKILPPVIGATDIRGIIHSHSDYSDGANTLKEMAQYVKETGYQYLVISDHSQSAFYANGLKADRIKLQHQEIDLLNATLTPFKIFKSIESDILYNGNLDYPDEVLASFDLVIASVHSILKMEEAKATERIITAVSNPYTSILGHMTGRLLLSRSGYPVNHKAVIEACAAHNVVIELNAHPRRLDIDWKWIEYALEKNVLLSIDPDAHSTAGCKVVKYGVAVAQKAGLTQYQNLSSFTLAEMETFIQKQKEKRPK